MSNVHQIEDAVSRHTPDERYEFRSWFVEFDAAEWDHQLEEDIAAGGWDWLADEARQHLRDGRCTER